MKPYKGIIRIVCGLKKGCLRSLHKDVQPGCMDCPKAITQIINLSGEVLYEYKSPAQRTGRRLKKTKKEG